MSLFMHATFMTPTKIASSAKLGTTPTKATASCRSKYSKSFKEQPNYQILFHKEAKLSLLRRPLPSPPLLPLPLPHPLPINLQDQAHFLEEEVSEMEALDLLEEVVSVLAPARLLQPLQLPIIILTSIQTVIPIPILIPIPIAIAIAILVLDLDSEALEVITDLVHRLLQTLAQVLASVLAKALTQTLLLLLPQPLHQPQHLPQFLQSLIVLFQIALT